MVRKATTENLLHGLEICELCRGFKGRVLSVHGRKSVAGKQDAKFLQQPHHIALFNRFVRHFGKAAGIVDIGFMQIRSIFVTEVVVKPLLSNIKTGHTVI